MNNYLLIDIFISKSTNLFTFPKKCWKYNYLALVAATH